MDNNDKIIFLDIDGVLNSDKFYENRLSRDDKYSNIDINTINLLNSLEIDNLKIVISSSYGEDGINLLKPLLKIPIVGCTKHSNKRLYKDNLYINLIISLLKLTLLLCRSEQIDYTAGDERKL